MNLRWRRNYNRVDILGQGLGQISGPMGDMVFICNPVGTFRSTPYKAHYLSALDAGQSIQVLLCKRAMPDYAKPHLNLQC